MSRGVAIAALLAAALTAVLATDVAELASGAPTVSEESMGEAIAPVKRAHRPMFERFRSSRRVLGVRRAQLNRIAECESHGNPQAVSSDGTYRGKYQFDKSTWHSNGGTGDPAAASELEQDLRAAQVIGIRGSSPWPSCG